MKDKPGNKRNRWVYAICGVSVLAIGLFWRSGALTLSWSSAKYGGDALWALMVFMLIGFILVRTSTWRVAMLALCFAWGIEFLQLYHAPWIDTLRGVRLGHLVLGSDYHSPDLVAYAVGIGMGTTAELLFEQRRWAQRRPR